MTLLAGLTPKQLAALTGLALGGPQAHARFDAYTVASLVGLDLVTTDGQVRPMALLALEKWWGFKS